MKAQGGDVDALLAKYKDENRDNSRTPMQWDDTLNGGFTNGEPWFPVNPNYKTINVAQQLEDEHSVLQFYKDLIQLRKSNDVYVYGQFDLVDAENSQVFAYTRTLNEKQVLIVGNLTNHEAELTVPFDLSHGEVKLFNYDAKVNLKQLRPYEACVIELN